MITKFSLFFFLFVAFSAKNRENGILRFTKTKSNKLFSKNMLQLVEEFSEPRNAMKMSMIDEQWSEVKITGDLNLFPNQSSIKVWHNMESHVVFWDDPEQLIHLMGTETRGLINMCLQKTNTMEMSNCLFDVILVRIFYPEPWMRSFFKAIMDFIAENLDMTKEGLREIADRKHINPFVEVAKYDSLKLLSKLIQIDPRIVNTVNAEHCKAPYHTALHFAASTSCCNVLLQHGASVNAESHLRTTPLHFASFRGYDEVVEIFLKHNANTKIKSQEREVPATALDFARRNNHQRCIDLIEAHEKQLDLFSKIMNFLIAKRPTRTSVFYAMVIILIAITFQPQLLLPFFFISIAVLTSVMLHFFFTV